MKYYIMAPADIASGGPELAHQMCHELTKAGYPAFMYYVDEYQPDPVDVEACQKYSQYATTHVTNMSEVETTDSIVVFNEGLTSYIPAINNCRKILWWMSVDNYKDNTNESDFPIIKEHIELHLVQSFYALNYLTNELQIPKRRILYVSDYIDENYGRFILPSQYRQDIVLYNPKKGLEDLQPLINMTPWLKWIPLINLTQEQLQILMQSAKLYIDFGKHPGKDRIPREAAMCGCCIITNRKGSAAYAKDVPIPDTYKFDNVPNEYSKIIKLITEICSDYDKHMHQFDTYRQFIKAEKPSFSSDIHKMTELLTNS